MVLPSGSDLSGIVCPVKECLPLSPTTVHIPRSAVLLYLVDVPPHRKPALDLPIIVVASSTQVVPAIPLEPAARVLRVDPALGIPDGQWLRRVGGGVVESVVVAGNALAMQSGHLKPVRRVFAPAVAQVSAPED